MATFGFVAGTLVHTDKGLVPIEQIKVGDKVFSKHESGLGEQAYKRVASTFKSLEKMPIVRVCFWGDKGDRGGDMHLFCTDNRPFWSEGKWVLAIDLQIPTGSGLIFNLNDSHVTLRDDAGYVLATSQPDIGACFDYCIDQIENYTMVVDFRQNKPLLVGGGGIGWKGVSYDNPWHRDEDIYYLPNDDDHPEVRFYRNVIDSSYNTNIVDKETNPTLEGAYRAYVYNIEVEDFHTYYVGNAGIWVHALP
jgi:transcription-repair coupling factor (superfamily II helicase)